MSNLNVEEIKDLKTIKDKNLKNFILYGILFTITLNLYKPFVIKYLYRLGGTDAHVTLINSLRGIVAIITILPGLLLINKSINKKKMIMSFMFANRFMVFLMIIIPFLPKEIQPLSLILITTMRYISESIGNAAVKSFTGDVFSNEDRVTAISSKNSYSVIAKLTVSLIMFIILSILPTDNKTMMFVYQCLFSISFIIALFEIGSFNKLKELNINKHSDNIPKIKKQKLFDKSNIKFFMSNKKFNLFLVSSLIFHFGWQMGWPLFDIYQIKFRGATEKWLIVFNVISSIVMFFGYKFWNKQIHNYGNNKILSITTCGMAGTPILIALSPNLYVLAFINIITGFFTSGTLTVLLSGMLDVAPEENRLIYIGIHATLTSITLAIAPHIGKFFYDSYSIYIALFICSGFRLLGSISFFIRSKVMNKNI